MTRCAQEGMVMLHQLVFVAALLTSLRSGANGTERRTSLGLVRGRRVNVLGGAVEEYRGIPYALPPVGDLRFRPPVPAPPWEGILDARNLRTACPQTLRRWSDTAGSIVLSEDCLYLNVWTPVARWADDMAPMLVWIHGGGFTGGSSAYDNYTAATLAARTGLVVASFNYRLSILGFLSVDTPEAPGNMGLMDQRLALLWLRRNAPVFGGNPAMITVFGHSAGGMSVHSHLLSPLGQGLFRRAVMMSGNMGAQDFFESVQRSTARGDVVAALVGCLEDETTLAKRPSRVLACLREKSSGELVRAAAKAAAPGVFPFLPTFHTEYLPRMPVAAVSRGFAASVDVLVGVTANEGSTAFVMRLRPELQAEHLTTVPEATLDASLLEVVQAWTKQGTDLLDSYAREATSKESLRDKYVGYLSDRLFVCPMHFVAEHHSAKNGAVYSYVFGHRLPTNMPSWIGAGHSMELTYFFGHPLVDRTDFAEADVQVTEAVLKMLSTFAEKGVPELQPGGRPWPQYTASKRTSIQLVPGNMTAVDGFRLAQCEEWLARMEAAAATRHCGDG